MQNKASPTDYNLHGALVRTSLVRIEMKSSNQNSMPRASPLHCQKLQIQYGSDHYELFLSSQNDPIRVEQLMDEIEKRIKVPRCHQTVMHKGQRLEHEPHASLLDLHIFNNSRLILSGTQRRDHDKSCCPDHDHRTTKEPQTDDEPSILVASSPSPSNLTGFTPLPNKTYE